MGFCNSFFTFFWETPRFQVGQCFTARKGWLWKKRREIICRRDHRKNGCFSVQKSLDRIWKFPPFSSSPSTFWHHLSQDFLEEIIFEDNLDEKVSVRFGKPPKVHSCPGGGSREKNTHNTRSHTGKAETTHSLPKLTRRNEGNEKEFPSPRWSLAAMTKDRHWREGKATAIVKAAVFVLMARAIL